MRSFEFARKIENIKTFNENNEETIIKNIVVDENGEEVKSYIDAQIPEYQTKYSAGADFFAAEDVVIPSMWKLVFSSFGSKTGIAMEKVIDSVFNGLGYSKNGKNDKKPVDIVPTLIHTGIKACMEEDEVLELYNRSSNPKKLGLILANSVGVIDKDYYNNPDNDGEIMFAFYNLKLWDVKINKGDRIGQGVFKKFLRPEIGLRVKEKMRDGGFGSSDKN